ncbi:MAG: hypothetical protein QM776_05080 [Rhodocyclaceae bacterium]
MTAKELSPASDKASQPEQKGGGAATAPNATQKAVLTPAADKAPAKVQAVCPTAAEVVITYGANASEAAMTATALSCLREICSSACIKSVIITSTARTATDQARIMYDMIKSKGAAYVKGLYSKNGDEVVDVYESSVKAKKTEAEIKQAMLDKINEVGPSNVSHHVVAEDGKLCVFDVAPSSIPDAEAKKRFVKEVKAHAKVATFYEPPADPAYHLEVTND